ncbi:hypothetical protein HPHPH21_0074 [Helicobacter pylori Hp H-21]|nr:hypothetical protein HPHPH21_0074 [Helicobacter pylori Hp H-21]
MNGGSYKKGGFNFGCLVWLSKGFLLKNEIDCLRFVIKMIFLRR